MKHIQWFPGHMTKAMRMMSESVRLVDGVIVVLDARAPYSCINRNLEKLFENRPVLYALNKADAAEPDKVRAAVADFGKKGIMAAAVTGTDKKSVKNLLNKTAELMRDKTERNKAKGVFKPMRFMVAGIPNTGKSTLINTMCGAKKAVTGNKAGVTKGKQWIRLDTFELLDTPGTMPPAFENQEYAKRLAYLGSINDDILDFNDLAEELLTDLAERYPVRLKEKYGITDVKAASGDMFEEVCKNRGYLLKGGETDKERCARALINDLRTGRFGAVYLD